MPALAVNRTDVARVFREIDTLVRKVRRHALNYSKQAGDAYNNLVKEGIGKNKAPWFSPGWEPLAESWKLIKTGHNEEFWKETGGIERGIRTEVLKSTLLMIHIFAGLQQKTDAEAFRRALRNEYSTPQYGGGWGPARPLFGPAIDTIAAHGAGGDRTIISAEVKELFKGVTRVAVKEVYGHG